MAKSIMQQDKCYCYLCGLLHGDYSEKYTEEHHVIFGSANRKLSEKYGLKIYLCPEHHRTSIEAVHVNSEIAAVTKEHAQRRFEQHYKDLDWMQIFGRNYIQFAPVQSEGKQDTSGFIPLEMEGDDGKT